MVFMADENAFDSLVSKLSAQERQTLLDKMRNVATFEGDTFTPIEQVPTEPEIPLSDLLKKEPISIRFFLWVRSLFSSSTPEQLLNRAKVNGISRSLVKNYPGLIDPKKGMFLPLFYDRLCELKRVADFFRPYIATLESDESAFYIFLGSMIMPSVTKEMNESVDPYTNPIMADVKLELRVELLRKMDDIFANIPPDLKRDMYEAVKSVEWLRRFVRLPFSRFINLFLEVTDEIHTCQFDNIETELAVLARCLCNGFMLSDGVLESLYLFSVRNSRQISENIEEENDKSVQFMLGAKERISVLKLFMDSVPMLSLCCVVYVDCNWRPEDYTGGEDWFVKFKAGWKKIFEQKWEAWTVACKREMLRQSLHGHFGLDAFPKLPNRPWLALKGEVSFRYEMTAGFLTWYFLQKFPSFELSIKTLMQEGVFKKKENQIALADSFNTFLQISVALNSFNDRLKPSGDVGVFFGHEGMEGKVRTLSEQSKIEQTMTSIQADIQSVLHRFGTAARSLEQVLAGVLGIRHDKNFEGIGNLNKIKDNENLKFQKTIADARQSFESALNLVSELEMVDNPQEEELETL